MVGHMASEKHPAAHEGSLDQARHPLLGFTPRSLVIALLLCWIASHWINWTEVIARFSQITEAVPPIPAVGMLLLLVVINPLVRRISKRFSLERREIIIVYVFLTVATTVTGCGIGRFFMNTLPVLFYFDTPENNYASLQQHMPTWLVPHDLEVTRRFYEASEGGSVPWGAWAVPLIMWGIFFLAVWLCMLSLSALFNRQWAEREKLTYPLLYLPMECTDGVDGDALIVRFLRNRLVWIGFGIAFLQNVTNIINSYNPAFTCIGRSFDLGGLFTEHPLSALRPMTLHYRPELIGFGYLVTTEIALGVWVFYLLMKLETLATAMAGIEIAGYPFWQERGLGAYVAMCVLLFYVGRQHIGLVLRKAFTGDPSIDDSSEAMSYRVTVFGGLLAFIVLMGWLVAAGMALWLALVYMILVFMVAVVYARIRAEVGVPLIWMYPYYQTYKGIRFFLGSQALRHNDSWQSATIFATLTFMSRGYYSATMGYQVEGYRLARGTGIKQTSMTWVLITALVVGYAISMTGLLRVYYEWGAGGMRQMSDWGQSIATAEYTAVVDYARAAVGPDVPRIIATTSGFVVALALMLLRMTFLRFPLHPLAFCMICSYGELVWGPFFIVWLIKSLVFKLGGMRAYRQLIPMFVGLVLGHYITAGVLYGIFGSFAAEGTRLYSVYFG